MNNHWKYEKIGDVCTVERGGSPRPIDMFITDDENGINWIKIGDTTDSMYITETAQKIIPEGMKKSRYVKPGDFLLSNSMSFGRPYILAIDGCIHDGWLVLRDDKELFDKRFLYYYLSSKTTYEKFKSMAVGGVVNNLNSEMVRGVNVPVPNKEEQADIADLLDRVKKVIDERKEEIDLLDNLIKARFVEMFGDPIENPRNLNHATLDELSELITKGASPSWQGFSYTDDSSQTLFVTSENVREGYIDLSSPKYIEDGFNDKQKRSVLRKGDFLINIVGASIGRAAQFNLDCKANMNQAAALVRISDQRIRDKYLTIYLNSEKAQQMYDSMKSDTGRANLSLQDIANLKILLPPVEEQVEFENFVEQVDKSKVAVQKALEETQMLFDSLMQEYFG